MNEKKLTVMVVEDEAVLLKAIGTKLENHGLESILCPTGEEALKYLLEENKRPSLIWLDYHLTDMDGLEFMAKLDAHPELKEVPIVVVSNTASSEKINAMLLKGAKKYLVKAENKLSEIIEIAKEYANQ